MLDVDWDMMAFVGGRGQFDREDDCSGGCALIQNKTSSVRNHDFPRYIQAQSRAGNQLPNVGSTIETFKYALLLIRRDEIPLLIPDADHDGLFLLCYLERHGAIRNRILKGVVE